jgi:hypothetical protein
MAHAGGNSGYLVAGTDKLLLLRVTAQSEAHAVLAQ